MLKFSASATCALAASVLALTMGPALATPTAGYVASTEFVACTEYDGLSALGSPLETVAGVANAGTVRVRRISSPARRPSTRPASACRRPVTSSATPPRRAA